MAEQREDAPYKMDTYNPFFTERKWTPFYKRHTFTGAGQADQAANLITSPSFQKFWSGGGNQADYTTGIRLDSATRDVRLASTFRERNIDYIPQIPPKPTLPTPPSHIRSIQLDTFGYPLTQNPMSKFGESFGFGPQTPQEAFEHGMFVPAKNSDIWPHMTPEEQAWWHERTRGLGEGQNYNSKVSNWHAAKGAMKDIPIELRNISGALPRDERRLINTLNYGMDAGVTPYLVTNPNGRFDMKNFRLVNASDPSNLSSVSDELSQFVGDGRKTGRYVPPSTRHKTGIMMLSSTNPEHPLSLHKARGVLEQARQMRSEYDAINVNEGYYQMPQKEPLVRPLHRINNLSINGPLPKTPHLDIPETRKDTFNVSAGRYQEEIRRVGTITPNERVGRSDAMATTTTLYGPPAKGMAAEVALNNTLHYTGKTLGVAGAALEGVSIPWRKYQILNQMRAERGEAPMSEPYDINKFPEGGISDQIKSHMLATGEAFVNFGTFGIHDDIKYPEMREQITPLQRGYLSDNGQRVPNWVPNLQSTYQDRPRYERQGVSFNHLYPKAPR